MIADRTLTLGPRSIFGRARAAQRALGAMLMKTIATAPYLSFYGPLLAD
jgi:hypothetical protein